MRLLELTPAQGLHASRYFQPGEAYADYRRQLAEFKTLASSQGLISGLKPGDPVAAHAQHKTAAIFAVEGGDFIEDDLDRVHEAFHDGVRAITLVHYHINQIGDIQTEAPVHKGLTALGKSIVAEMNKTGILIDLAQRETRTFSNRFARLLMGEMKTTARMHKNPLKSAAFKVLKAPDIPSVLVELGYVSNKTDMENLLSDNWRSRTAGSMAQAIDAFFAKRLATAGPAN